MLKWTHCWILKWFSITQKIIIYGKETTEFCQKMLQIIDGSIFLSLLWTFANNYKRLKIMGMFFHIYDIIIWIRWKESIVLFFLPKSVRFLIALRISQEKSFSNLKMDTRHLKFGENPGKLVKKLIHGSLDASFTSLCGDTHLILS